MLHSVLSLLLSALLFFSFAPDARAQNPGADIRQLLQQRDREIKRLLGDKATFTAQQRAQLQTVVNDNIDFAAMSRLALGAFWDDLTVAQRTHFVDVFSEVVRRQSLSNLDVYRARVAYGDVDVEGDSAYVHTTTTYKDVPARVDYVMHRTADGWRVQDIILDDVSTAGGYARSFQAVIRKRGFDTLMKSLERRLEKTQTG